MPVWKINNKHRVAITMLIKVMKRYINYCRHEFHKGCVDPWLLEHRTCPMCKMDILKYYGFIVSLDLSCV